jgi:hypothetical protein
MSTFEIVDDRRGRMIMLRIHTLMFIFGILLVLASTASAQDCEIVFGRGGASSDTHPREH